MDGPGFYSRELGIPMFEFGRQEGDHYVTILVKNPRTGKIEEIMISEFVDDITKASRIGANRLVCRTYRRINAY